MIENEHFVKLKLPKGEEWAGKKYKKCSFTGCTFSECTFINCEFEECVFENCNFSGAAMAMNKQYDSGKYINCTFSKCNFKHARFNFPLIEGCAFVNCKLKEVDFDGSRLVNTRFEGELDSVFFRGYSKTSSGALFSFSRFDARKVPNTMQEVDFSKAKLVSVSFSHAIPLNHCIFPTGEEYLYIADRRKTISTAKAVIETTWEGRDRQATLQFFDLYLDNKDRQEQTSDFIDAFTLEQTDRITGNSNSMRLFHLLRDIQNQS